MSNVQLYVSYKDGREDVLKNVTDQYVDKDWIAVETNDSEMIVIDKKDIRRATFGMNFKTNSWY